MTEVTRLNAAMDALTKFRGMVDGMKATIQAAQEAAPMANFQAKWDTVTRLDQICTALENWALTPVSRMVAQGFDEAMLCDFHPHLLRILWAVDEVPTDVGLIKEAIVDPNNFKVVSPREYDRLGARNAIENKETIKFFCDHTSHVEGGLLHGACLSFPDLG